MARRRISIRGLVRLSERVRQQVGRGLDRRALTALQCEVEEQIGRVEQLCREAGITPARLPAPTRNAYRYLAALDFRSLPEGQEKLEDPVRLRGLQASYEHVLDAVAAEGTDLEALRRSIGCTLRSVQEGCAARGISTDELGRRSADALAALGDLVQPGALEALRETRARAEALARAALAREHPREARRLTVLLKRTHALWRLRETRGAIAMVLSDGYVGAPDAVLQAVISWALGRQRRQARRTAEEWLEAHRSAPAPAEPGAPSAKGVVYDLDELFEEVNREHFGGQLGRPQLGWTRVPTYQRFGSYSYARDQVVLSASLDHREVPRFVVAYVLYHELLHKALGTSGGDHGRGHHDRRFRSLEHRFPRREEASRYLDRLARRWR